MRAEATVAYGSKFILKNRYKKSSEPQELRRERKCRDELVVRDRTVGDDGQRASSIPFQCFFLLLLSDGLVDWLVSLLVAGYACLRVTRLPSQAFFVLVCSLFTSFVPCFFSAA